MDGFSLSPYRSKNKLTHIEQLRLKTALTTHEIEQHTTYDHYIEHEIEQHEQQYDHCIETHDLAHIEQPRLKTAVNK